MAFVSVELVLGNYRPYHIGRTSTGTEVNCVISVELVLGIGGLYHISRRCGKLAFSVIPLSEVKRRCSIENLLLETNVH